MKKIIAWIVALGIVLGSCLGGAVYETEAADPGLIKLKFDLGGKGTASGYIGVSAKEGYDKKKGYGFGQLDLVEDVTAKGSGALSDAVWFHGGYGNFKVDLPNGVYKITVTTGNDESSTITAEDVYQLLFMTGNNAVDSFTIPVTDGQLNIYTTSGVGAVHSICTLEIEQVSTGTVTKPTIWLCGDSTVASYYNVSETAKRGWGEYLHNYVDMETYDIRNISVSGLRSWKLRETFFPTVEKYGKKGDILVLAIGINDYIDGSSSADYIATMTAMVKSAKSRGMRVCLVKQNSDHGACFKYPLTEKMWFSDELDSIAASEKVEVIDLFTAWRNFCLEKGQVVSARYYNEGVHPNKLGADKMAEFVAAQMFPSGQQSGPVKVDPYPDFDAKASVVYETAVSGEVITNPHKGYVMEVHNPDMLYSGKHRLGIDGSLNNQAWNVISACCSVLYWEDINPAEGTYDFSEIDAMLKACENAGFTYAIRIIPYSTATGSDDNYGVEHDFVPEWVYKKGAKQDLTKYKYKENSPTIKVPKWDDPIYIQAYKDLLTELAKRYDKDPRVEYIEVRAFGNMGEWHTSEFTDNDLPSVEIQEDMLAHYAAVFKNTTCCVFVDARDIYDYTNSLGFAKRNDGLIMAPNTEWELVPSYRANVPTMGDNHNTYLHMKDPKDSQYLKWTREHYRECIEISHLTFFALDQDSGCGYEIYREQQDLIDEMCNRLGYNFTVTSAKRNGNQLKVTIKNTGLAPAFFNIDLCAEITDANGNKIRSFGSPIRIEKGSFHDGDERSYLFTYNGTLDENAIISLAMYDADNPLVAGKDPTIRFDNKNNFATKRLRLVAEAGVISATAKNAVIKAGGEQVFTVKTTADAKYLMEYAENGNLVKTWTASSSNSTVSGNVRTWTVSQNIRDAGKRKLTFKAGKTQTSAAVQKTATFTVEDVWVNSAAVKFATIVKGTSQKFTVKTTSSAKYLMLYAEAGNLVKTWAASGNSTVSGDVRTWTVNLNINTPGNRTLTLKAGKTTTPSIYASTVSFKVVNTGVISASAKYATINRGTSQVFTVKTTADAKYLVEYAEDGKTVVKAWTASSSNSTVSGNVRTWTLTQTIRDAGNRNLIFKAGTASTPTAAQRSAGFVVK